MPSGFTDPRAYVRQVPIPVASHKGVRIQARSLTVYNATEPSRNEVRQENYTRRQTQMAQQGFKSANNRPYQGLGDPFYLEPKELVLHALGQWDGANENGSSETDESDDEKEVHLSKQEENLNSAIHAMRLNRDTNELNKRLAYGRQMIRSVSLGRSFRKIVKQEADNKARKMEEDAERLRQLMRTTLRPANFKFSLSSSSLSSSDGNDEEAHVPNGDTQDSDSNGFHRFSHVAIRPFSCMVQESTELRQLHDSLRIQKSKSASHIQGGKGQQAVQRPYTPQHSSIAGISNRTMDKGSVFRQLCVVHWLLEAMNIDPPRITRPLSSCWNARDVNETEAERLKRYGTDRGKRENKLESQWKQFSSTPAIRMMPKRNAKSRVNATKAVHNMESSSVCSTCDTWEQRSHFGTMEEDGDSNIQTEVGSKSDVMETNRSKCPSPKCREASLRPPSVRSGQPDSSVSDTSLNSPQAKRQPSIQTTKATDQQPKSVFEKRELRRLSRHAQIINLIDREDEESRIYKPPGVKENLRAEANIRPKSSAAVLQYQTLLPSNRVKHMMPKMKIQFTEVAREQGMVLKDALDALDRNRLKEIERRYDVMPTDGSVRTALQVIRSKEKSKDENKAAKEPEIYQTWFLDLMQSLSSEMNNTWYFQKIMAKLSRYGLVESGKQSVFKFTKVLAGLRNWEICSPDISAAIEFCRERVVEMDVTDYEAWFHDAFPNVVRPQPPVLKVKPGTKSQTVF